MAKKNKQEYDKGYQEAIETIKKALAGNQGGGSGGGSSDPRLQQPPVPQNGDNSDSGSGSGSRNQNQSSSGQSGSRTNSSDKNQGIVRPEDCIGPDQLSNIPSTPGTFMDRQTGDKIAEQEGYDKEGGSDSAVEKDWADTAVREANKLKGNQAGSLKSKIEGLQIGKRN